MNLQGVPQYKLQAIALIKNWKNESSQQDKMASSPYQNVENSSEVSPGAVECACDNYAWWIKN